MKKAVSFVLLFFFVCSLFVGALNLVSADMVQVEWPDSWNERSPMTKARAGLGVVAVHGKVYAIGGYTDYSHFLDTNEQYDPKTDTWTTLEAMPTPRHSFAIAAYHGPGKIYCIGGEIYKDGMWFKSNLNEMYDVATNSWSVKAPLPLNGSNIQAHEFWGEIYVIAGNALFVYDPFADTWTAKTSMPISPAPPTSGLVSAVVGNKIVVTCRSFTDISIKQKVAIYDISNDVWSEGKTSPEIIGDGFAAGALLGLQGAVYIPERMHVFLGDRKTLSYDPTNDTWTSNKGMPTDRKNFGIVAIGDVFYIIGGYSSSTQKVCTTNEQYTPITYATISVDSWPRYPSYILMAITSATCIAVIALLAHFGKKWAIKKNGNFKKRNTASLVANRAYC
jgi:hypothetical protein